MKIVRAELADVPRILPCAREFTKLLGVPLNEEYYTQYWRGSLLSGAGAIFLLLDNAGQVAGGIGGTRNVVPLTGELVAIEAFWYIRPEHREGTWGVRLLKAFEDWAIKTGATSVCMIHMERSMPDSFHSFYPKMGYTLSETLWTKKMTCATKVLP